MPLFYFGQVWNEVIIKYSHAQIQGVNSGDSGYYNLR
jgi:hypothetical protein